MKTYYQFNPNFLIKRVPACFIIQFSLKSRIVRYSLSTEILKSVFKMEGIIYRVPTLRTLARTKVITELVSAKSLKYKFNRSLTVQEKRCQCCALSKYKKFVKFACRNAKKLHLPKTVIDEIVPYIKLMSRDIVSFLDEINDFLQGRELQLGDNFHWDMYGKINIEKTLENYVFNNESVPVLCRFVLACLYCCESIIFRFWEQRAKDLLEQIRNAKFDDFAQHEQLILRYWSYVLSKKKWKYIPLSMEIFELTKNTYCGSNLDYFVKPNAKLELMSTFLNYPTEYNIDENYSVTSMHEYILTNADHSAIMTMLKIHKNGVDLLNCILDRYYLHQLFDPIFKLVLATDSIEEDQLSVLRNRIRSRSHFDYWFDVSPSSRICCHNRQSD